MFQSMKEDRRIQLTTKGNKKVMLLTQLVTLTGSQEEKLNCEQLLPELERIAKTLEIDWAVELSANIEYGTLAASRTYEKEIGEYEFKSIEKATQKFLNKIDKLELPQSDSEPKCPSHEEAQDEEDINDFVTRILQGLNDRPLRFLIVEKIPLLSYTTVGSISSDLIKEMCELYLKAHE